MNGVHWSFSQRCLKVVRLSYSHILNAGFGQKNIHSFLMRREENGENRLADAAAHRWYHIEFNYDKCTIERHLCEKFNCTQFIGLIILFFFFVPLKHPVQSGPTPWTFWKFKHVFMRGNSTSWDSLQTFQWHEKRSSSSLQKVMQRVWTFKKKSVHTYTTEKLEKGMSSYLQLSKQLKWNSSSYMTAPCSPRILK